MLSRPHLKYRLLSSYSTLRHGTSLGGKRRGFHTSSSVPKEQTHTVFLYLDNIFPLCLNMFDVRPMLFAHSDRSLERIIGNYLPLSLKPVDIIKRKKDGGALVKFEYQSSTEDEARRILATLVTQASLGLKNKWAPFNFSPVRSFLVKGQPFLEDMVRRYPTKRLRVEFQGDHSVGVEALYEELRQYGKIYNITLSPNCVMGKDPPRYAIVQFTRIRAAASARNCLHGCTIDGTRINILYERHLQPNTVKEWLLNHPRITLPILTALLASLSYVVFDPVREFFVSAKMARRFNLDSNNSTTQWLRQETMDVDDRNIWSDDTAHLRKLKSWLREKPGTFIIINGPTGSGKTELVKMALKDRRHTVIIDCETLADARTDLETTKLLAKQVGYFPVFTWTTYISNLLNSIVAATTGQSSNSLSSTPASIDSDILDTVGLSLATMGAQHGNGRFWYRLFGIKEDNDSQATIPVIFIDNFMKHEARNAALWASLAEWAAVVTKNGLAHVVFATYTLSTCKVLIKALPGKSFSLINLLHTPPDLAIQYVSRHIGQEQMTEELYGYIQALGGRFNELETLVQKINLGISPNVAFQDIVQRNVIEVRQYGFGEMVDDVDYNLDWSVIQFWAIVKQLCRASSINYEEIKWDDLFGGRDQAIHAMERAELVTILYYDGRPSAIQPGKPVYYSVFRRLLEDTVFAASLEIETFTFLKERAEKKLAVLQAQITELSSIFWPPTEVKQRLRYLLDCTKTLQINIESYDKGILENKAIVSKAWRGRHTE